MRGPVQRWNQWKEQLRFKYTPRIVDWLVRKSIVRARTVIGDRAPLRILVDNPIFYHAVTHETAWVSTGEASLSPHRIDTGYEARIPVHSADSRSRDYVQICYLAGINGLCQAGLVELYTSAELQDEQFRQPAGRYRGYGYSDHCLFDGSKIDSIDGHVMPTLGPAWLNPPSAEQQQRERIAQHCRQYPAYDELVRTLGPNNSQDAWHIFTAERNELFCFLTMDFKLIKNVAAQSQSKAVRGLRTRVITPEDLGRELRLFRIPPHLFSYHDASFPVRPDLSMPGGKRRPVKQYRSSKSGTERP